VRLPSGGALHETGPAGGTPILFLHGVGGGAWSWAPQTQALGNDYRCFAWEARGHGLAARVADAGLGDYFVDAREALEAVETRAGTPFVAGHSMGGLLALALAAEAPAQVRGLLLLEPVYAPDGGRHGGGLLANSARVAIRPLVRSLERNGAIARTIGRSIFRASFEDRGRMERAWRRQRAQVPTEYPKMMYEAFEGPTGFPNRAFARELVQPVLLVEGSTARERPRFPELVAELRAGLGERFTYLTLEGGHYLQLDRTAPAVTAAFTEFVQRWR
jgi:pimeloyl-ACP methyl ester carboxylesterase